MKKLKKKILIVAAHPDDEILGCGGTIARLTQEGYVAYTMILGEGLTARDKKRKRLKRIKDIQILKEQVFRANKIIGVKKVFTCDFPDNRFDKIALLEVIKKIEEIKEKIRPDIVFTHYKYDLNIDHQITYKAVITATRPKHQESVKIIYSFEILSSTEWNYPLTFCPNVFFDISRTINLKLKAMSQYKEELMDYPHPRSLKGLRLNTQYWGMRIGLRYAEAFKCIRILY